MQVFVPLLIALVEQLAHRVLLVDPALNKGRIVLFQIVFLLFNLDKLDVEHLVLVCEFLYQQLGSWRFHKHIMKLTWKALSFSAICSEC